MRFFELFIENKNLIKQGLYLLEICQNAAGSTDIATDCRVHDGPSWTSLSHTCAISSAALFITLDCWYDGSSEVYVPKHLSSWNMGTGTTSLNNMTNLQDGPSWTWQTVMDIRNPTLGQTSPSSFSSCTTLQPTDRHKHDGPSQAP